MVADGDVLALAPSVGDGGAKKNAALDSVLDGAAELYRLMDAVTRQAETLHRMERIKALVRAADATAEGGDGAGGAEGVGAPRAGRGEKKAGGRRAAG